MIYTVDSDHDHDIAHPYYLLTAVTFSCNYKHHLVNRLWKKKIVNEPKLKTTFLLLTITA